VEWLGIEIHPEIPAEGRPLTDLFRAADIENMMTSLRITGAPFGITFTDRPFLSNSRPALQAVEFARSQGRFQEMHQAIFAAYFSQGLDIGDMEILMQLSAEAGLDPEAMKQAVLSGQYVLKLEEVRQEAGVLGLTGVPTFFIGDKKKIVGSQPLDVFRKILRSL
jgi:predicted DsbA family dithiol-disulfide isomerase